CGCIGNCILARAPIRPNSAWKTLGVIGPSRSVIKTCEDGPCSRCRRRSAHSRDGRWRLRRDPGPALECSCTPFSLDVVGEDCRKCKIMIWDGDGRPSRVRWDGARLAFDSRRRDATQGSPLSRPTVQTGKGKSHVRLFVTEREVASGGCGRQV